MRTTLRRVLSALLALVPLTWLEWLRHAYARAPLGTRRRRLLGRVLEVVRHRSLAPLTTFSPVDAPTLRFRAADSLVLQRVYWFGEAGYEGAEARWWRHFCARSTGVLELGANIGYYTVQGASAAPAVVYTAVEPHPGLASLLREHLALNGLDHVRVVEAAVVGAAANAVMELALPDVDHYAMPTGAYLAEGAEAIDRPAVRHVTVDVVEARTLMDGVDLVKLDVEGYEHEILESVLHRLRAQRPTIFVEVRDTATRLRQLVTDLCSHDAYAPFAVGATALHQLSPEDLAGMSLLAAYASRDVVLVPAERVASVIGP